MVFIVYHKTANFRKKFRYLDSFNKKNNLDSFNQNLKAQMTSQNVVLWNINIAMWIVLLIIALKFFQMWKMSYLTFNRHNFAMGWAFYAGFRQFISHGQLCQYITIPLKQ